MREGSIRCGDSKIVVDYIFVAYFVTAPLNHSLARLFPLEKRSLSETVVSMARCIPTHHFTVLMRQQE